MRSSKLVIAVLALVASASCTAHASIQIQAGDYIHMTDGIGRHGGVFHAQETNSTTSAFFGDSFQTFCVEFSEFVHSSENVLRKEPRRSGDCVR